MTANTVASMALDGWQGAKRAAATRRLWWSEIDSFNLALSLPHCSAEVEKGSKLCNERNVCASSPCVDVQYKASARYQAQEQRMNMSMKGESTEHEQGNELAAAMTEEPNIFVTVSDNGTRPKHDAVPLKDWLPARSTEKNPGGLERMESGLSVVTGSGGESDGCEDLSCSMSMEQARRLPSSQYKGVVPQPNGRWGAQIYEKHQRVWLGTFNKEEDAARAYDRAALKVRGRDAMTNLSTVGGGPEAQFMREHSKEEIVEMLRKHTYEQEMTMTVSRLATLNNAEASREETGSGLGSVCKESKEHLFDKAVTPSDVGKLNRLVIPKLHAEKYFPLDAISSEKGQLLNFEDNTGKVWRFRYSYWNSSQSYVLTKGWSRFVKDKKLEADDIVSFHRGSTQPDQLYISWRRRPPGQTRLGVRPKSHQSKVPMLYPMKASSSLNLLSPSRTEAAVVYNAQRMPIFWPSSKNPDSFMQFNSCSSFPLVDKVGHISALWSHSPVSTHNGALPFYRLDPPTKETYMNREGLPSMHMYLNLQNSINSGDGSHIKPPIPLVNKRRPSAAQESKTPEDEMASCVDAATTQGIRLFGVTLLESQRFSPQCCGELNLFR